MKVLALDPSSTCVGYALLQGLAAGDLLEAGRLRPTMAADALPRLPGWLHLHLRAPGSGLDAAWRITVLTTDAIELVANAWPDRIVVEIPSGLVGTGARRGARGSLTTYGLAAGSIWGALSSRWPHLVAPVTERQWTRASGRGGRGHKEMHRLTLPALYPHYKPDDDPGADVADAIGLARWWIQNHPDEARMVENSPRLAGVKA